jgi:uncharacterized membrane protein YpjA
VDWDRVWEFFHRFKAGRGWALALMVPNLLGIGFGYYYYYDVGQFDPASQYFRSYQWWPFIADSPNAVLLMSVALLLYAFGRRRSRVLDAVAFTAMVYVGLWTTFLFLAYPERMGTFDWASFHAFDWSPGVTHNANPVLFVSHMGMPLEALLLVRDLRRDAWPWLAAGGVLGWNVLHLLLDYWGPHLHPAPFLHAPGPLPPASSPYDSLLHAGSPWIMAFALAVWLWVVRRGLGKRSPSPAQA